MIGAAFAAAAPGIPSWSTGFQNGNDIGGLIAAVLAPAGGFGKFLLVLVAMSTSSACVPTIYSFGEYSLIMLSMIFFFLQKLFLNHRFSTFYDRVELILFFPFKPILLWLLTPFSLEYLDMSILSFPRPCKWITLLEASSIVILNLASLIPLAIIGATRFYAVLVATVGKSLSLQLVH